MLTAALLGLDADRHFGSHVFDPANGGAILYQHLFWFFGHPEVYIVALPFFGIVSEVIPVFSRKPLFGYRGMVYATARHRRAVRRGVGAPHVRHRSRLLPFFSFMTFLIAIPTGLKFFNWIGTMWKGQVSFETPMLFAAGFLVTFLFGGLTGVILAAPPLDFHVSDTYFVVAHFHYVLFGTIVFATFAGIYFWFPKMTGRFLDERLGRLHFWTTFIGFHTDVPDPALARQHRHAPPVRGLPADRRLHHVSTRSPPSARSCSAPRRCRSSGTSSGPCDTGRSPRRTTPGVTATRWSGPPAAHRRGTTSCPCRGSAPNGRPSSCTTPR